MVTELFPILSTPDLPRALAFYRELLGGIVTYEFPGADGAPVYVSLSLGGSSLGIGVSADERTPGPHPISLWVYVDDCDSVVERLRQAGVAIVEEPADQPWGERVARVLDPDGSEVIIGARTRAAPASPPDGVKP